MKNKLRRGLASDEEHNFKTRAGILSGPEEEICGHNNGSIKFLFRSSYRIKVQNFSNKAFLFQEE